MDIFTQSNFCMPLSPIFYIFHVGKSSVQFQLELFKPFVSQPFFWPTPKFTGLGQRSHGALTRELGRERDSNVGWPQGCQCFFIHVVSRTSELGVIGRFAVQNGASRRPESSKKLIDNGNFPYMIYTSKP